MSEGHFFLVLYRTNIKALRALCKNLVDYRVWVPRERGRKIRVYESKDNRN